MLVMIGLVNAQLSVTSSIKQDCWEEQEQYSVYEITKYTDVYYSKNDSTSHDPVIEEIVKYRTIEVCNPAYIEINEKTTDFALQNYNCKKDGLVIVCDSCLDGNCDGVCSSNGGETCAKINSDGSITFKNSVIEWNDKSDIIPVTKLEVSK